MRPGARNLKYEHAYAIIRLDRPDAGDPVGVAPPSGKDRITVKLVVRSPDEADREVDRLNALNAGKGCEYFWQVTRLERCPSPVPNRPDA